MESLLNDGIAGYGYKQYNFFEFKIFLFWLKSAIRHQDSVKSY